MLLMYKSSLGPDYHSALATWATVALFLLTTPSSTPFSFSFKCLSAYIKTEVKCTRCMLCLRQIRSSCIQTRVPIRKILQTSACSPCPHHLHRSPCCSKKAAETRREKHCWKSNLVWFVLLPGKTRLEEACSRNRALKQAENALILFSLIYKTVFSLSFIPSLLSDRFKCHLWPNPH